MFCRFGLVEDSRPVAAPVWLNVVCTRPSRGSTCLGSASRYVEFSLSSSRQDRIASTIGWTSRSFSRTLASVESWPFGVFFPGDSFSLSYRIARSCGGEFRLNSSPASS